MNYKKLFFKAQEAGIEAIELFIKKTSKLSFNFFNNEMDSYSISDSYSCSAKGIFNGKMGYATSEKMDDSSIDFLIKNIVENAKVITSEDENIIFKGSEKYKKKNVFNKELEQTPAVDKIALAKELVNKIKSSDSRISDTEVSYQEVTEETTLLNSYGLKLSSKQNYGYIVGSAVATDEEGNAKDSYEIKIFSSLDEINLDELARRIVKKTFDQFNSSPCESGKYKCVFDSNTTSSLLTFFINNLSSEEIQKNTSLLKDKLNQKVCSPKITITESPLLKNPFFRYFDDEGVATNNKVLVKNGVLQTYLYNLKTAKKDNINSTGNGYRSGIKAVNVSIKPGKISEEELIKKAGNGIYITSLGGLHSGMNSQSGNFSLIAQGFLIKDGKLDRPVSLITIAGNLFNVFNEVIAIANNVEIHTNSYMTPSILVKGIQVSGK